eukprot:530710_1
MGLGYSTIDSMKTVVSNNVCQFSEHKNDDNCLCKSIIQFGIKPDIITTELPKQTLKVRFKTTPINKPGQAITPTASSQNPQVTWDTDAIDKYYTLIMVDPDPPSRKYPIMAQIVHWMVINIPLNELNKGVTIASYRGPGPPPFTGFHRYIFLLYEQIGNKLSSTIQFKNMKDRIKFNVENFANDNELKLVGSNFFISQNIGCFETKPMIRFIVAILLICTGITHIIQLWVYCGSKRCGTINAMFFGIVYLIEGIILLCKCKNNCIKFIMFWYIIIIILNGFGCYLG